MPAFFAGFFFSLLLLLLSLLLMNALMAVCRRCNRLCLFCPGTTQAPVVCVVRPVFQPHSLHAAHTFWLMGCMVLLTLALGGENFP